MAKVCHLLLGGVILRTNPFGRFEKSAQDHVHSGFDFGKRRVGFVITEHCPHRPGPDNRIIKSVGGLRRIDRRDPVPGLTRSAKTPAMVACIPGLARFHHHQTTSSGKRSVSTASMRLKAVAAGESALSRIVVAMSISMSRNGNSVTAALK